MFKAFLAGGRSSDTRSTSSSQKSSRRRTDSRASSTVSGKSSRGDDRDRGLGDPSTYPSFGTRSKRYAPSAAGDSVASSYATAEPGSLAESDRIIERSPKRRETNDSEYRDPYQDASELDGNPRRRQDRARSPSRERERRRPNRDDHPNEMDNDDHGNRRERKRAQSGDIYMSPTSVAGANLIPDMPGPDHPQFPPPIHSAHPVTSMPSSPNVTGTYDPNAHQQFPGQFPAFIAEPYRPPNPAGEAAEYYGDQGQSVAQQPGVRPKPPTVIPNSQPHLMSASPTANPPPEPSSMGEVGAAAAYYDDVELENQASTQSNYSPSSAAPRPPRPTIQTTGISGPGTAATAGIEGDSSQEDVEFASPALPVEPSTSNTVLNAHNPLHTHSGAAGTAAMGAAAAYIIGHNQQSSSNVGHSSQYSNHNNEETSAHDLEAPGPFAHPSHPGATLYPANAEVPAAYAAHPLHPDPAPLYHGSPFQSGELAFQQRQRGPLDKFIDFWRDPEGVGMFEDYTESIGVCKHCFEPGTTSRDAPRKHEHKPRRRSSDRYSNGSRVDKANRYTSSEDEGRRRKQPSRNSWLPGMLAGYTLKSLFSTKDFEDTYNIRPGRVTSSPQGNESVSTFERRSRTSHGVFRHSYHNSAELSSESHEELRRRSRSRSRSSSRSKKNSRVRDAALGAAIGVTTVRVDQSRDRHGSQSQSPQEAKSRKYSSSDSSFVDISRPARKSVVGGLSSFFTASSENRKKRRTKRRANFLATHNSSSSSSLDADLAFGSGYAKKLSNKPGKQLKKDRKDVDAALLELGAAATALAASSRWKRKSGEARASKGSRLGRSDSLSSASDDIWEDVDSGEQSSSSVSSALAFGGSGIYGSTSQSSESGTSFWGWRWGRRKEKKQKKKDSRISEGHSYTRTAVGAGALGTATLASGYRREGKMSSEDTTVSGTEGLQHVAPISTNDPSRFDVVNVPPFPSQPALVRPGPIPLQQPQPVTPVSQAVYTSQGESIHAYSASPRPPESASHDTSVPRDHGSQRLAFEPWSQNVPGYVGPGVVMAKPNRPPRRSDSLPVFHAEPLESVSVKRRSNLKDQASVQFDLTREQAERERVADRLDRLKRDMGREEGVQLVDRESDVVSFETQHRSRRYYEEHRDSNSEYRDHHAQDAQEEIGSSSAIGAATVGAVGAAAAYLSYEDSSDTNQRHHHERSEKRRAERRYVTSTESAFSSHSFSNRTYSSAGGVSNACHEEGHIKTSAFRDISRKKPIYDDYAQFFAPEELRHSPDMHARPVPPKITEGIEEEPVGEHAMAEGKSHGGLPGPVPELRLIEPTPPQSSTGSSRDTDSPRLSSPKITQDDKNPKSADTGSRVSWGKHEMHEYEVLSTSSEVDSVDHEFTTGPEQERQPISNSPSGWPDDQVKPAPRGVPEDHAADIDFAATVAAATAAAGFDDSLTSHIREELVSSPKLPQSYVEDEVEVSAKYLENQALYSEPESLARGGSVSDEFGFPSSIAQEVLEKLNRKKGPSEASKSAFTEGNTDYQVLRSSGNDGRSESPPAEALPMPGGFDEELSGQGKEHGYMCQISRDDMGSAVVVPVSGDKSKSKKETSKVDNLELSSADENVLFGTGAMSTEARKPPRKRHPRKDSDSPDGCASAPSTPLRVDGISDKNRSVEKEAKEKSFGGILASTLSSEAPEPIGNRLSLSSDVHSALEIRSEIEAKVLNRRDGESTDYRDTVEHLKNPKTSQDNHQQASFLAKSPEMPTIKDDADIGGASGRFSSVDTTVQGLGVNIGELRLRSRSASPVPDKTIGLSPKSESRSSSPELSLGDETDGDQQSRRSPGVQSTGSPTAVPLNFRRPPTSPRVSRSTSVSLPAVTSPGSPTGRNRRPASGEFRNSREIRPLWLVERHGTTNTEVQVDEPLPSLPSSRTSSPNASADNLMVLQDKNSWEQLGLSHHVQTTHQQIDDDVASAQVDQRLLGSQEVTPTARDFEQTCFQQPPQREKPKYEFHSPSELLQDPSTYVELPPSPTLGALASAEGSTVGVKEDEGAKGSLENLPPLPPSRPSTPENQMTQPQEAALTKEQMLPSFGVQKDLTESDRSEVANPTVASSSNNFFSRPHDNRMELPQSKNLLDDLEKSSPNKEVSRSLSDETVLVFPGAQDSMTEVTGEETVVSAQSEVTSGLSEDVAAMSTFPIASAKDGDECSGGESQSRTVNEDLRSAVPLRGESQLERIHLQGLTKQLNNSTGDDVTQQAPRSATEDIEPLTISSEAFPPPITGLQEKPKVTRLADATEAEASIESATVNKTSSPDEAVQMQTEAMLVESAPGSSTKKQETDREEKNKSVDRIHESAVTHEGATHAVAAASSLEINEASEAIEKVPAEEPVSRTTTRSLVTDKAPEISLPITRQTLDDGPGVDILDVGSDLAAEKVPDPEPSKPEEFTAQTPEEALTLREDSDVLASEDHNAQTATSPLSPREEPGLGTPKKSDAASSQTSSADKSGFDFEASRTDVTNDMDVFKDAMSNEQWPALGVSEAEDAPLRLNVSISENKSHVNTPGVEEISDVTLGPSESAEQEATSPVETPVDDSDTSNKGSSTKAEVLSGDGDEPSEEPAPLVIATNPSEKLQRPILERHQPMKGAIMSSDDIAMQVSETRRLDVDGAVDTVGTPTKEEYQSQGTALAYDSGVRSGDLERAAERPGAPYNISTDEPSAAEKDISEDVIGFSDPDATIIKSSTEAASMRGIGGEVVPSDDSNENHGKSAAELESTKPGCELESVDENTKTSADLAPIREETGLSTEEQQGLSTAVSTDVSVQPEQKTTGTVGQSAGDAKAQGETPLSRKSSRKNRRKNKRRSGTEPIGPGDVPPHSEPTTLEPGADFMEPTTKFPESKQPVQVILEEDGALGDASHTSEATPVTIPDALIEPGFGDSPELAQEINVVETPGESSENTTERNSQEEGSLSASESLLNGGIKPNPSTEEHDAETPLSETNHLVHPANDRLESTTVVEPTESKDLGAISSGGNELNLPGESSAEANDGAVHIPEPEPEAEERSLHDKEQCLPTTLNAEPTAVEHMANTDITDKIADNIVVAEEPIVGDQEPGQQKAIETEHSMGTGKPLEDSSSPEITPMTAAQSKKARKHRKKKQRNSPLPDDTLSQAELGQVEPASVLDGGPDVEKPETPANEKTGIAQEQAQEQPAHKTVPGIRDPSLDQDFDQKPSELSQTETKEASGISAASAATEKSENPGLAKISTTDLEADGDKEELPTVEPQTGEEQSTVELADTEQESTGGKLTETGTRLVESALNNEASENTKAAHGQWQGETHGEAGAEQDNCLSDELVATVRSSQDTVGEDVEPSTPKGRETLANMFNPPPSLTEPPRQQQEPSIAYQTDKSQESLSKTFRLEPEVDATRETGLSDHDEHSATTGLVKETQQTSSKRPARKDKKNDKSVTITTEGDSLQLPEIVHVGRQICETNNTCTEKHADSAEEISSAQPGQKEIFCGIDDEEQPIETYTASPEGASPQQEGELPLPEETVSHDRDTIQPPSSSDAEIPSNDWVAAASHQYQTPPAVEPENKAQETEMNKDDNEDSQNIGFREAEEVKPATGISAHLGSGSDNNNFSPEQPPPEAHETTTQEEIEVKNEPASLNKDTNQKRKKRKSPALIEDTPATTTEHNLVDGPADRENPNDTTAPEIATQPNDAIKGLEVISEVTPLDPPKPHAENAQASLDKPNEGSILEPSKLGNTSSQAVKEPIIQEDSGTVTMSAKEKRKAKKKEKKRQSKNLDVSRGHTTHAESAAGAQNLLTNAGTPAQNVAQNVAQDIIGVQTPADIKAPDSSVDAAIPPAEEDGNEHQSHGNELHGETDKNMTWTDHLVSSQVDQQQAASTHLPQIAPEGIEAEPLYVSENSDEHLKVRNEDHPAPGKQQMASEIESFEKGSLTQRHEPNGSESEEIHIHSHGSEEPFGKQGKTAKHTGQNTAEDATLTEPLRDLNQLESAAETFTTAKEVAGEAVVDLQAHNEEPVTPSSPLGETTLGVPNASPDVAPQFPNYEATKRSEKWTSKGDTPCRADGVEDIAPVEQLFIEDNDQLPVNTPPRDRPVNSSPNTYLTTAPKTVAHQVEEAPGLQTESVEPTAKEVELIKDVSEVPEENKKAAEILVPESVSTMEEAGASMPAEATGSIIQEDPKPVSPSALKKKKRKNKRSSTGSDKEVKKHGQIEQVSTLVEPTEDHEEAGGEVPGSPVGERRPMRTEGKTDGDSINSPAGNQGHAVVENNSATALSSTDLQPAKRSVTGPRVKSTGYQEVSGLQAELSSSTDHSTKQSGFGSNATLDPTESEQQLELEGQHEHDGAEPTPETNLSKQALRSVESPKTEASAFIAPFNKNKGREGKRSPESIQPEEEGETNEKDKAVSFDEFKTKDPAKGDGWPIMDRAKNRIDVEKQNPQSSPEALPVPFAPDMSAESNIRKPNMDTQGEDAEALSMEPELVAGDPSKPFKGIDTESAFEASSQRTLSQKGEPVLELQDAMSSDAIPQKQGRVANVFPELERGAYRRPITMQQPQFVKNGADDETVGHGASREDAVQVSEAPAIETESSETTANPLLERARSVFSTAPGFPGLMSTKGLRRARAFQLTPKHRKNDGVHDAQADTMETSSPTQEAPLYAPAPIHGKRSAIIHSSPGTIGVGRVPSPQFSSNLDRSPSIRGQRENSPSPWSLEDDTPNACTGGTPPPSSSRGSPAMEETAGSPSRTPLQPIAEHEPVNRLGESHAMTDGRETPRLEMKPEHVLPRPETPVRKFTDNSVSRLAWPTPDKDEEQGIAVKKHDRIVERGRPPDVIQSPEKDKPILKPSSVGSLKSVHSEQSQRSLRRMNRSASGDLRAASQAQTGRRQSLRSPQPPLQQSPPLDFDIERIASSSSYDPVTDKGKRPLRAMTDVYEGWGETPSSPRSPSRPPSIRHRRSIQHLQELETRLDQLSSENRLLIAAREAAENKLRTTSVARRKSDHALNERDADLRDRAAEVEQLKSSVDWLQKEVSRLSKENDGLIAKNTTITAAHASEVQSIRESSNRELYHLREQNQRLSNEMQDRVRQEIDAALTQKNTELRRLREDLESARDKVKELQQQIAASMQDKVLIFRDEDYFDAACQKLCGHVQQWVLRFSKHSDLRRCRKLDDIQDEKIADRFENAILDGSDADAYLADRVGRRDVFMSVVMTMVWEFIFTRYLFGMDREQRQKLKSLEKQLAEMGPRSAIHRWRATTLSLLSKRPVFSRQRDSDTEAVALEIFETLSRLLPPPSNVESQLLESLRKVLRVAVNLSIEMRTQLAEYIMLPPLQPEYDTNGDLARKVCFNASLMNERSGETTSNEELESQIAVVRVVLFPLVVKKGNDMGEGEDEVVVCPAQVLVARPQKDRRMSKMASGDHMSLEGSRSAHSIALSSNMDMSNVI